MFTALATTRCHAWKGSLLAVAMLPVLLSGCRTARDNQIELLERELRVQEDYIYELEDYVVQYSEKLRSMKCAQAVRIESAPSSHKSIVKKSKSDDGLKLNDPSSRREEPAEAMPEPEQPEVEPAEEFDIDEFEPPPLNIEGPLGRITIGTTEGLALLEESDTRGNESDTLVDENDAVVNEDDAVLIIPSPHDYVEADQQQLDLEAEHQGAVQPVSHQEDLFIDENVVAASSEQATPIREVTTSSAIPRKLVIKQLFRNDEPGVPQSLLAVVEAHNAKGQPLDFTGEVSLMVAKENGDRPLRIKRWDFYPRDVSTAWQSSELGDGLHLELPLEDTQLPAGPLQLWVRLVDVRGGKLLSQRSFQSRRLTGLEVETGAKQLQPEEEPLIEDDEVQEETTPNVPKPEVKSRWRSSTQRTGLDSQGYASTVKKTSGWTSQPTGGRFPHSTNDRQQSSPGEPIWTAGRVRRPPPKPAGKAWPAE